MIEGNEYIDVNELLNLIEPYDIYQRYLGYTPEFKRLYLSPFRPDSNPSFGVFISNNGTLLHKDFGDDRYKGNCIAFVQQLFNLNFKDALNRILSDFNPNRTVLINRGKYEIRNKEKTKIQIIPRKFDGNSLKYWNNYGIDLDDLKEENIYCVNKLYINKLLIPVDELCFAYLFIDEMGEEYMKIYQPFSKTKWLSNVPVKKIFNLDKLEKKSNTIVVAKSKKDKIVTRKLITDVYEVQKEGTEVISSILDGYFNSNYDRKVCFFDNDGPGKRANIALNPLGYDWINVPNKYYVEGIKDPSDFVEKYGYKPLEKLLKEKGLL